ncbi:MAG TPA: MFS transporter [Gaiellaceae bacterium]|nr:MFS transporter [Gaiellaceae bacterium]
MRLASRRQLAPLRHAGFRLLAVATLGSTLGTLLAAVALAIDVKDRTNSGLWVGAVAIVSYLPTVLVGLTLGPLIDRLERRKLIVVADLVRAAVFAALPFASNAGEIVALATVAGLANGFFRPAVYAGVPNLVPEDELAAANGFLQTMENVSWMVGPLLGGLLTAAAGPHAAYWINAVSFLFSAILLVRIPKRLLQSATALTRGHVRDLRDGFVVVLRSRPLLAVMIGWGIACFGIGGTNVAEVFLAKNTFHAGDFGYGMLYGSIGAGLVVGSFAAGSLIDRLGAARSYGLALFVMALGFGAAAASPNVWVAAACVVVGGVGDGIAIVGNSLLVQRGAPDEVRGRALTLVMSGTYVLTAVGNVLAGALLHVGGARWVWAGAAVCFAIGGAVGYVLARDAARLDVRVEAPAL